MWWGEVKRKAGGYISGRKKEKDIKKKKKWGVGSGVYVYGGKKIGSGKE